MQPRLSSRGKGIDVASVHIEETAPSVYKLINLAVRVKRTVAEFGQRILKTHQHTYIHSCKYSHFRRKSKESTLLQALMILGPRNGNLEVVSRQIQFTRPIMLRLCTEILIRKFGTPRLLSIANLWP
jgi:hypothetical protein